MEMVMSKGFVELSTSEINEIDGGVVTNDPVYDLFYTIGQGVGYVVKGVSTAFNWVGSFFS